ncbi:hypothetical protein MASR2M29_02060 [Spirochaetota bacterium]
MKAIVSGKRYDTATATEIGEFCENGNRSDFRYLSETLYMTKSGQYFLAGEGGAMTVYKQSCGSNSWCGGERIVPMTRDEAFKWASQHLSTDETEAEFADMVQDA